MKTFQEYTNSNLQEAIGISDGQLVFNYNNAPSSEEISSRFGKKHRGEKFVPYSTTTQSIIKHNVYSVYFAKGVKKTEILKAIKRKSNISMSTEDYNQFINRTGMYIDYRFIRKFNINTVLAPASSSPILIDIIDNLSKRNGDVVFFHKGIQ